MLFPTTPPPQRAVPAHSTSLAAPREAQWLGASSSGKLSLEPSSSSYSSLISTQVLIILGLLPSPSLPLGWEHQGSGMMCYSVMRYSDSFFFC